MGVHNVNFLFLAGISFVICTYFLELVLSQSRYEICKPKSCKTGPNISYPFYFIDDKMDNCGSPGFEIKCEGGRPTYRTSGASYVIENIDYENHSFLLVSIELGDPACPKPIQNFSFDRSSLEFAPNHAELAFFYNCDESFAVNYSRSLVTCDPQATNKTFTALVSADEDVIWENSSCESVVSAPIQLENGGINQTIVDIDYKKLLKDGFTLKWVGLEFDCGACQSSGGRCGFAYGS